MSRRYRTIVPFILVASFLLYSGGTLWAAQKPANCQQWTKAINLVTAKSADRPGTTSTELISMFGDPTSVERKYGDKYFYYNSGLCSAGFRIGTDERVLDRFLRMGGEIVWIQPREPREETEFR